MACPFFMPVGRLSEGGWTHPPRLPLGDSYHGLCYARPADVFAPGEAAQRDLCNCGYVQGQCAHFPGDSAADAVRFSITGDLNGQVRLVYVFEKNHAPAGHGTLEYVVAENRLVENPGGELLAGQARAFLDSYLRRRIA